MKTLADNLKFYARKLGLSDAEVARRSGLSEVRYGHYVRGRSEPDLGTLLRICKTLNITPDELLLRSEGEGRSSSSKSGDPNNDAEILRNRIVADVKQLGKKNLRAVAAMLNVLLQNPIR